MDVDAQRELFRALTARRAGQSVHVDLGGRDLTGAQALGADLVGAELAGAILAHASLAGSRLARANLEGADLSYCDLGGADLTEANLRHANLTGARLDDAVLAGTDLRDTCIQGVEGDPLSMAGARLNKGTIRRSELKMRDIARLVVRGAVVNERESLLPRSTRPRKVSIAPSSLRLESPLPLSPQAGSSVTLSAVRVSTLPLSGVPLSNLPTTIAIDAGVPQSLQLESPMPQSLPLSSLAIPASEIIVAPLSEELSPEELSPEEFSPPSSLRNSIVPSMREREIEARQRLADLDDEVPASLRFMQRMNALIIEARPSLVPRSSRRPPSLPAKAPAPVPMPVSGDEFLGAVLGELLPGSTTTRTFRATTADGVRVLVKVFDPERDGADLQLPAFQRGLRALCRMHGCRMPDGSQVRVAELFAVATDLTAYVVRDYENGAITNIVDVAITMRAGLEIFRSVCETVAALHREGVLVRSFKPNNILIDGLSPLIGEIDMVDLPALAEVRGDVAGYGSYVAPEELLGQGTRSPTADVYALGKLVDYLLTGHEPIAPVGSAPLIADRKGTSVVLVEIVKRCLSRDPADRYQYVDDLLEDLENFEANGAKATLQASMRPGALSRLKAGPSLIPAAAVRRAVALPGPVRAGESERPGSQDFLAPVVQRALGILGLCLGSLGLSIFYLSPATVDAMELAQIAVSVVLGLGIWVVPRPKKRVLFLRLASWAAAAAVVYLAQPIQLSRLRWQHDLQDASISVKEAAIERLARLGFRDFSGKDLRRVRLERVDLGGARFRKTRLEGADLRRAFLSEADFTGANLTEAQLYGADLRGARLEAAQGVGKAACDGDTRLPSWLTCRKGRPRMQGPRPTTAGPTAASPPADGPPAASPPADGKDR
jgi:uncharacterized protein YjbI with pentapeptide repeats